MASVQMCTIWNVAGATEWDQVRCRFTPPTFNPVAYVSILWLAPKSWKIWWWEKKIVHRKMTTKRAQQASFVVNCCIRALVWALAELPPECFELCRKWNKCERLFFPSNFTIWCTSNSNDGQKGNIIWKRFWKNDTISFFFKTVVEP